MFRLPKLTILLFIKNLIFIKSAETCFTDDEKFENRFIKMTASPAYKKWTRPSLSGPVFVNLSLEMNDFASLDALRSEYSIQFMVNMEWFDRRLSYSNESCKHDNIIIEGASWYLERIWYPTIVVQNTRKPELESVKVRLLRIKSDGYVLLRMRMSLMFHCYVEFNKYPFDNQSCLVRLESKSLSEKQLVLRWHAIEPFKFADSFDITGFESIKFDLQNDSVITHFQSDRVSRITVMFYLIRGRKHLLLEIYIPNSLCVIISWFSFWLKISSCPARVTLGMTTMLTIVTTSFTEREKLPRLSSINYLDIWIVVCICFVFASLIEYMIVYYIYYKDKLSFSSLSTIDTELNNSMVFDVQKANNNNLSEEDLINDLKKVDNHTKTQPNTCQISRINNIWNKIKNKLKIVNNAEFAQKLDVKCRFIFPLCFTIFNITYWLSVQ